METGQVGQVQFSVEMIENGHGLAKLFVQYTFHDIYQIHLKKSCICHCLQLQYEVRMSSHFYNVAMMPGKRVWFGTYETKCFLLTPTLPIHSYQQAISMHTFCIIPVSYMHLQYQAVTVFIHVQKCLKNALIRGMFDLVLITAT